MTKTEQKAIRLTMTTVEKAAYLAKVWGPRKALSLADVVALAIDDAYAAAKKKDSRNSRVEG